MTNQQEIIQKLQAEDLAITKKVILDLMAEHNRGKYVHNWQIYEGEHDILKRRYDDASKPNNRLVNDYQGEIIDRACGYFMGIPVTYTSSNADLLEAVRLAKIANNEELCNSNIVESFCVDGKAYELHYVDEEAQPCFMWVKAQELYLVKDGSILNKAVYGMRYYDITINDNPAIKIEMYDSKQVTYYILIGSDLVLDDTESVNPKPHFYGEVPIVEYLNNTIKLGDWAKVQTLIDDYDNRMSDDSNELDYFRNAYLMVKNMAGTDKDSIAEMKEMGAFLVEADGDVKFLTKDVNDGAVEHHLDRLNANIHRFSKTPDISDENFAGNLSGIAIKFKMGSMEEKCIKKELYMRAGLRKRWNLINKIWTIKGKSYDLSELDFVFTRNIPANDLEEAQVAATLKGVVSNETLLGQLSFINDPAEEMKKLKKEQEDSMNYSTLGANTNTGQGDINAAE